MDRNEKQNAFSSMITRRGESDQIQMLKKKLRFSRVISLILFLAITGLFGTSRLQINRLKQERDDLLRSENNNAESGNSIVTSTPVPTEQPADNTSLTEQPAGNISVTEQPEVNISPTEKPTGTVTPVPTNPPEQTSDASPSDLKTGNTSGMRVESHRESGEDENSMFDRDV